jgi:hypothetical protein
MKKLIVGLAVVSILAVGAIAYAQGNGAWGGGHMGGQGYGGHMTGQAYGGQMMGGYGSGYGTDQKYLDETTDLRKELHNKRFEYSEATRDPKTTTDTLAGLEKEIYELQAQVHKNAPGTAYGRSGGLGCN